MNNEVLVTHSPGLADMQTMAKSIAGSGMFGVKTADQAMALMLLCQAEGIHPIMALRRYHIIDGKPAYRADALQGEFERDGAILWHERDEKICAATFWRDKHNMNDEAIKRAKERYDVMIKGGSEAPFAMPGEITVIRTFADAIEKNIARTWKDPNGWEIKKNWKQSPRQMLHARCLTEGVRAINPGLVAGIYTEDEVRDSIEAEIIEETPSRSEIAERNVKQATANATATNALTRGELVEHLKETVPELKKASELPPAVTIHNYKDVVCHIGKAQGEVLGRKVGELHPNVIAWLMKNWRDKLGPSATDEDMRLKIAIEFATENLKQGGITRSEITLSNNEDKASEDKKKESATAGQTAPDNKVAIATALIEKAKDLILTPDQFCRLLVKQGLLDEGKVLHEATMTTLKYLETDEGWRVLKEAHELDVKPQDDGSKPQPARKRARRK
jgi:hypothetical protein